MSEPAIVAAATKAEAAFFILGPPVRAWRDHAIATPSTTLRNSRRCMSTPERAIVSGQLSAWIVAGFELLVAKS